MRRSEWLLLPLFLLPLAVGGVFCLHARDAYLAEVRPFKREGERVAQKWLAAEPGRAAWLVHRFVKDYAPGTPGMVPDGSVPVSIDGFRAVVACPFSASPSSPWIFSRNYPAGLTPTALASDKTRLAIETGTAPIRAGGVDAATTVLAGLLPTPDEDGLRTAPLPPTTKLFLLDRWKREGKTEAWFPAARRIVSVVRDFLMAAGGRPEALSPGAYLHSPLRFFVSDGTWPAILLPRGRLLPFRKEVVVRESEDRVAKLVYSVRPAHGDALRWTGRLTTGPLAGRYSFLLPYGSDWWEAPFFTRWAGLVAGACLLFLLLPSALLVSLVRRRRLDEARARFVNELAHDLRTPLTSLRLYAEMLAAGKAPGEDLDRYVDTMARESERLTVLLANLLDLSRLERGARDFAIAPCEVEEVVETALADFAALYPDRGNDVRVMGEDGVRIRVDRVALVRCLGNLLDNAGKYTPGGTPIRIGWQPGGNGTVRIRVEDEGPGIPVGERGRVFRRYERGRAARKDGVPGTGLGLALVVELVKGMGGKVRLVDSERGAAFEIDLPASKGDVRL